MTTYCSDRWGAVVAIWLVATSVAGAEEVTVPPSGGFAGAAVIQLPSYAVLKKTATQRYEDVPLSEILTAVEELSVLQVRINHQALTDAGVESSLDQIVALWDQGETIARLAERIGEPFDTEMTWTAREGILTLTTAEDAALRYWTARYFIGDLLGSDRNANPLIEMLQTSTSGPWDVEEPGTGTVSVLGNHLFVRQTHKMQGEVEVLLAALRRKDPILLLDRGEADLRLLKLLDEKSVNYEWPEISLTEYAQKIAETTGERVELDTQALNDAGIDSEATLSARAKNINLGTALREDLAEVNDTELTVTVQHGSYWITTAEDAEQHYETIVYQMESLGITGDRLTQWVELVQSETSGPWDADEPGTGTIVAMPKSHHVVIRQTAKVQREIAGLLHSLRSLPPEEPLFSSSSPVSMVPETRFYAMNQKTAEALLIALPIALPKSQWSPQSTSQEPPSPANSDIEKHAAATKPAGALTLIPVPKKATPDGVASTSTECFLAVTQPPAVHDEVVKILAKLGINSHPSGGTPFGGGGGFFQVPSPD